MKDDITIASVRALTIAGLLEQFANSNCEAELPSQKRQAWNIAQTLRFATKENHEIGLKTEEVNA
jgi:hypothetical protein